MKVTLIAVAVMMASGAVQATGNNGVQQQIDDLKAGLHQTHMNVNSKYSESWGLEDRANIGKLQADKLDKSVFTSDQQRQDKALAATVTAQAGIDAKQSVDLKGYADKKATSAYQTAVSHTDVKVARADADRKAGDDALGARITAGAAVQSDRDAGQDVVIQQAHEKADAGAVRMDGIEKQTGVLDGRVGAVEVRSDKLEEGQRVQDRQMESDRQQRIDGDAQNSAAISQEARTRASQVVQLSAGISQAQATGDYAASRADQAFSNAAANSQSIRRTNERVAEHSRTLANHEQRLGELERNTSSRFSDIDKRIDENKRSANAGIAAVAAFSNIPQVSGGARFSAGVGVGQRGSEQAVAVGFSSQLTDSVIGKVSVGNDSQQQWTVGAGLAVQW